MLDNLKDQLKSIIFERIRKDQLKDASFTEVISTLRYIEENDSKINTNVVKSLDQTINEYLGLNEDASPLFDYYCLPVEDYPKFGKFISDIKENLQINFCILSKRSGGVLTNQPT